MKKLFLLLIILSFSLFSEELKMRKIKIVLSAILLAALFSFEAAAAETPPVSKDIELTEGQWLELAKRYPQPQSAEYKLIELALNIVLADYLEKAQQHT